MLLPIDSESNEKKHGHMPFAILIHFLVLHVLGQDFESFRPEGSERLLDLGHPSVLEITGADRFGADSVLRGLLGHPDFFEASHPSQELRTYSSWLEAMVGAGYQHEGFGEVTVEARVDPEAGRIELAIREGRRWIAGDVRLEGAQHFDSTWLQQVLRAGRLRDVASEDDAIPPGLEFLEPTLPPDVNRRPVREFWVPGEPARLSQPDRVRLQSLAEAAVKAAGWLKADLTLRWEPTEAGVVHPVFVISEGPLHEIEAIRLEGEFRDPRELLNEWIGLPIGTPATESAMRAAVDRLQATGRFGSVRARFDVLDEEPNRVELVVHVTEAPDLPRLEDHPFENMQLLRRAMLKLSSEASDDLGVDVEVILSSETVRAFLARAGALGLTLPVPAEASVVLHLSLVRSFLAIEVSLRQPTGEGMILLRLFEEAEGGFFSCPPLNIHLKFPAHESSLLLNVVANYAAPVGELDKAFDLEVSGGITSANLGSSLQFHLGVSPSALLYLYGEGSAPESPEPGYLTRMAEFDGGWVRGAVDRETAEFHLAAEFEGESIAGKLRFGNTGEFGLPIWSSESIEVDSTIDSALAAAALLGESSSAVEGVLLITALNALFSELVASERESSDAGPTFVIPRVPGAEGATAQVRQMSEIAALRLIHDLPRGSWGSELVRTAPFLMFPATRDELAVAREGMMALSSRADLGPVGAWWAAELCDLSGYGSWAANLAPLGLQDLSSTAMTADVGRLVDLDHGRWPSAVGRAWHGLSDRARSDGDTSLTLDQRELLETTFAIVGEDEGEGAWVRAGLSRLWEAGLRAIVEERLRRLAAAGRGR